MSTPTVQAPERVPWSELGPHFIDTWGRPGGKADPEHVEITGQNGSGKTYLLTALLQERALFRGSSEILLATKQQDSTLQLLGWPVVDTWRDVQRYRWATFWPQTTAKGTARKEYHRKKIQELLDELWRPDANVVLAFDEVGYIESLSKEVRETVRMYWREGRSEGITVIAMKQRPVGVVRDQHSESRWKFVFPPADAGDMRRFAELLGPPREWEPVLRSLDQEAHEFVVRSNVRNEAYISWIDYPIEAIAAQSQQAQDAARKPEPAGLYGGKRGSRPR